MKKFLPLRIVLATFVFAVSACATTPGTSPDYKSTLAFVNVNVLTMMDESPKLGHAVIVEGGVIVKVGPMKEVRIPKGARIVDGKNQSFVIPGLADTHVHLTFNDAESWLKDFVANGVTTVFNLKGAQSVLELKQKVNSKKLFGPYIYTSGPFLGTTGRTDPATITAEDIEKAVVEQKKAGYDFVKIHGNFTKAVYKRMLEVAKREGIHVTGHIPRNLKFQDALDVGQRSIAHTEELIYTQFNALDEEEVRIFAKKAGDAEFWMMPGIITFRRISKMWGRPDVLKSYMAKNATSLDPSLKKLWKRDEYGRRNPRAQKILNDRYLFHYPIVKNFYAAGVKMMTGTDFPLEMIPAGTSVHDEIDALIRAGLTPFEALKAATANPGLFVAKFVDPKEKFGQVREGYRADLILLRSNPLNGTQTLRRPIGVMNNGQWNRAKDLRTLGRK